MSCTDVGEPMCFPSIDRRGGGSRSGLCARNSGADGNTQFLFLFCHAARKAAVSPSWQTTFVENPRAQVHAVYPTSNRGAAASSKAKGPPSSPGGSPGSTQRGTAGAGHNEAGHDLGVHANLERHCGTPWFS
jgi:hypothetical protein